MTSFLHRLVAVSGTALILAFFSEFFFLNEGPVKGLLTAVAENPLVGLFAILELSAFYGLFAYGFLICLNRFRVGAWPGLILAAGVYGIAAEGLFVPMIYEALPLSLIWTSLSWHTLVDVGMGWFLLRRLMRTDSAWPGVFAFAILGASWGFWATWFWVEAPADALSLGAFAVLSALSTVALGLGLWLADHMPVSQFRATWAEIAVVVVLSGALFVVTGLPFPVGAALVMAVFLATLAALRVGRNQGDRGLFAPFDRPPPPVRYLAVSLMPVAATVTYAAVLSAGFAVPTEDITPLIFSAGALSYLWALAAPFWRHYRLRAA